MASGISRHLVEGWLKYTQALQGFQKLLSRGLGQWGGFVGRQPVLVLLLSLLIAAGCLPGLMFVGKLSRDSLNDIWVDKTSKSYKDFKYVDPNYPEIKHQASITADALNGGNGTQSNVLTLEVIREAFRIHEAAMAVSIQHGGVTYTYPDICNRLENHWCDQSGLLSFWNFSSAWFEDSLASFPTAEAAIIAAVNVTHWPDGREVDIASVFSDDLRYQGDALVGAVTTRWSYQISNDVPDNIAHPWSTEYAKVMKELQKELVVMRIYYQHTWSADDESSSQGSSTMPLLGGTVLAVLAWATVVFSRVGCIRTRTSLGFLAFFTVVLGSLAGYGLSLYFGVIFAFLQQFALPFIMLALGVDMAFVVFAGLNEAIERHGELADLPVLFSSAMQACGLSITTTSLASIFAFLLGALTKTPAIRAFCLNAALCVLCTYILMLSFFFACLVLTEQRIRARRIDCCYCCCIGGCCCERHEPSLPDDDMELQALERQSRQSRGPAIPPTLQVVHVSTGISTGVATPFKPPKAQQSWTFSHFFGNVYGRYLTTPAGATIVLCIFSGWVIMSLYGIFHVKQGLPTQDLLPDKSYLQALIKRMDQTFLKSAGAQSGLYFRDLDFSSPATQRKMNQAWDYAKKHKDFSEDQSPSSSWLSAMADYVAETHPELIDTSDPTGPVIDTSSSNFYVLLQQFLLSNEMSGYTDDLLMADNVAKTGAILGCRFGLIHRPSNDYSDTTVFLGAARATEQQILKRFFAEERKTARRDPAFIYGPDYTFWQLSYKQEELLWQELGYAFLGCVGLMLIMLAHPVPAFTVVFAIMCVVVSIFGELFVFGLRLNPISAINTLMAVGLSIDYVLYATHKFLMKKGSDRRQRVMAALHDMGSAVFLGAATTICGMAPLLLADSAVLRYFAYLMIGSVVFGVFAGLAVVPVLMWFFGPEACIDDGSSEDSTKAPHTLVRVPGFNDNGSIGSVTPVSKEDNLQNWGLRQRTQSGSAVI